MKRSSFVLSSVALSLSLVLATPAVVSAELPVAVLGQSTTSLAPMLDTVLPAVVTVYIEGTQTQRQRLPEEFKFFFGPNFPTEREDTRPFEGLGSGVIIDAAKGYIVTNNHVINNATKIRVQLNDGREYEAKMLGHDEQSDIALLQIKDAKNLIAIKMADSDKLRVGDFAVAIGNPFGLGQTATSGIISALARSGLNMQGFENFIQTDASINRGNSGGALINLNGELVGINTAILAPNGGNIGIGFAIPSNMVQSLTQQLIEFGKVKRGLLGIKGSEMSADMAKALNVDAQRGAFVSAVEPKSAADIGGVKSGDVIISFDGKPIQSFAELRAKVATTGADKKVTLGILREGASLKLDVILQKSEQSATDAEAINKTLQGVTLSNGEVKGNKGILVDEVAPNTPAFRGALKKGDLIIGVNRTRVKNIKELNNVLKNKPTVLALNIIRGEENIYLILR